MCYCRCRWENWDGECRYHGAVPPCEREREHDEQDVAGDADDEELDGLEDEEADITDCCEDDDEWRNPDDLYDDWRNND